MSGSTSLKLYSYTKSTCGMRCTFTAFELGHPVEFINVDLAKGENQTPEHLARQPFGKVPAAQDGDLSFYESVAIARYLAKKYIKEKQLVPTDLKEEALFEQWMSLALTTYGPSISVIMGELVSRWHGGKKDEAKCKDALSKLMCDGHILNKHLEGKEFIANNKFSLVETCLAPMIVHIENEPEIQEWFKTYPNIANWYKRVTDRPAWKSSVGLMTDKSDTK